MNVKPEAALAYARMHWRIFPCHSIVQGPAGPACSCGKASCNKSQGKHPRTKRGLLDATDDPTQIRQWWTRWPEANIALATGSGLAVFDIDGEQGIAEFKQLVAQYGPVPPTLTAATGHGLHLVFATRPGSPEVRSSARGAVHVRGEGGYIIVAPSDHISGRKYQWINRLTVASLPDWLRQWSQGYEVSSLRHSVQRDCGFENIGALPTHLQTKQKDITSNASEALKTAWSPSEQARLISALQAIPVKTCGYDDFLRIGFALHSLDWQRSDGTSIAFDLWNEWCVQSEHHNQAGLESKWQSFERSARGEVSVATIYHMAKARGWNGGAPAPLIGNGGADRPRGASEANQLNGTANGVNGHQALPAPFGGQQVIFFPDLNEDRQPKATCANASVALQALDIQCRKDLFHEKMLVAGHAIDAWAGDMSDDVVQMIRKTIRFRFGFDPKAENVRDACVQLCLEHQFDPVLDYLDGLRWDGVPRLASWLQRYMGAPDTDLNRTIGQLVLIAAVRRARDPGAKFDQIVVFESVEGRGKSSAIEALAGSENFSDQNILGLSGKEQQEAMAGIWLYEIADLTGMKRAEIEHVKAFASRKVDRARPAYGRFRVDRARRTIFFATTNDDEYLKSQTGNRRFWPVVIGKIDLEALRQDRDQLWAEAARLEADGRSIALPEHLWDAAAAEQNQRTESDEWSAAIHNFLEMPEKPRCDVSIMEALAENQFLQVERSRVGRAEQMRAGAILRRMGFVKYRKRLAGNAFEWRYRRNGEQL